MDKVAHAAGCVVFSDYDDETIRVYNQDSLNPFVAYAGPFRFVAQNINSNKSVQLAGVNRQTGLLRPQEYMNLSFQVFSEPKNPILGTMQPTSGFGELFQYSNLMASAAGFIGAAILEPNVELGAAYDKAMRQKVFEPLGMRNTTFDFKRVLAGNFARPHGRSVDSEMKVIAMDMNYSIVPARR